MYFYYKKQIILFLYYNILYIMNYEEKYLKYKNKYLKYKNQLGGKYDCDNDLHGITKLYDICVENELGNFDTIEECVFSDKCTNKWWMEQNKKSKLEREREKLEIEIEKEREIEIEKERERERDKEREKLERDKEYLNKGNNYEYVYKRDLTKTKIQDTVITQQEYNDLVINIMRIKSDIDDETKLFCKCFIIFLTSL